MEPNRPYTEFISVVIPAFNEAHRIESTLAGLKRFLEKHFHHFEIVCVDDGSTDDTRERIEAFDGPPVVRLISLDKNRGKGSAVKQGILAAHGDYRFFTDADLPYDTESFKSAMDAFRLNGCDMIAGKRFVPGSAAPLRRTAGKAFSFFVSRLLRQDLTDTQCGFKAFTARAAEEIFPALTVSGYTFDVELFIQARIGKKRICRIPVHLVSYGGSKIRLTRDPFWMLIDLIRLTRKYGTLKKR